MPAKDTHTPCRARRRNSASLAAAVALLAALASGQAHGADPDTAAQTGQPAAGATVTESSPVKDEEPVCVHGCLRWGKFCNVDPRGVYKCRRRCEKFGEICE